MLNKLRNKTTLFQFVKFCIVGFSNTIISYVLYILFLLMLKDAELSFDYLIASLVSFFLSVLWSFYWNNKFTFSGERTHKEMLSALFKTYVCYSTTGLFLQNILLFIWVDQLCLSKEIAPLINLIITIPVNFILNKFWAFKQ